MAAGVPQMQPAQQPQLPPQLAPNVLDSSGLVDSNWFKVVVTKCPSGRPRVDIPTDHEIYQKQPMHYPRVFLMDILSRPP